MTEPKYSLVVSNGEIAWMMKPMSPAAIDKSVLSSESALAEGFYFIIQENSTRSPVAHIYFSVSRSTGRPVLKLVGSSEKRLAAARFFRTFRQSPFRLLLFSAFSLAKRNGVRFFISDGGSDDFGRGHKSQLREKLFRHANRKDFPENLHEFGTFPNLGVGELAKILQKETVVPKRLLPPSSVLRRVRAKSYAAFKLKRVGRKKYVVERRVNRIKR